MILLRHVLWSKGKKNFWDHPAKAVYALDAYHFENSFKIVRV